jgi:hypothetical protein
MPADPSRTASLASIPPPPAGPFVVRAATALGAAAVASVACTLPGAMRVSGPACDAASLVHAWVALTSAILPPMVVSVAVLRAAREGLRVFAGPTPWLRGLAAATGLAGVFVALSVVGGAMRTLTHHRALGGVTFAFVGLAVVLVAAAAAVRVAAALEAPPPARPGSRAAIAAAFVAVAVAWLGVRFVRAASRDDDSRIAAGIVIDLLAFALAAGFASRKPFVLRRSLGWTGAPAAFALVVWGALLLRDAALSQRIADRAPAFAPLVNLVARS